ncbi:MAG: hypothetical protein IKH15_11730, partial [Bacteroidales bacterium]|nr:hypothetical protein [Bacteroidales bacterium]
AFLTPEPDDAELAARALLESLASGPSVDGGGEDGRPEKGSDGYYHDLAKRVRTGREDERRAALRFVACCEERLEKPAPQIEGLEEGLFRHQTAVEREGGELKRRWQHCLAEVIVRRELAAEAANG